MSQVAPAELLQDPVSLSFDLRSLLVVWSDRLLATYRYSQLTQRYYLYPVHLSLSFLMTRGVNSALYLLLLRFLNRDYAAVSALVDSIATDTTCASDGVCMHCVRRLHRVHL
jgi:hypothetical protein